MDKHVLVVSRDSVLCQGLRSVLSDEYIHIRCAEPSAAIADILPCDLIIVDMPEFEKLILERLRNINGDTAIPILALHAKLSVENKISLYRAGASALLERTAELEICEAQAQALIRLRVDDESTQSADSFIFGTDLMIDPSCRTVKNCGKVLELTRKEFELLHCFARNPKQTLTFEQLYEEIWEEEFDDRGLRTLKTHICTLRKKMSGNGKKCIQNVWGIGYKFVPPYAKTNG